MRVNSYNCQQFVDYAKLCRAANSGGYSKEQLTSKLKINANTQDAGEGLSSVNIQARNDQIQALRQKLTQEDSADISTAKSDVSKHYDASTARIRDVDMAQEMVEYSKQNILNQAATSMLAQANTPSAGVLQLLR